MAKLNVGDTFTRNQIHEMFGGSVQSYLPHVNGKVKCICLTRELNPSFDDSIKPPAFTKLIMVGEGDGIEKAADMLSNQTKEPLPTFLKQSSGSWEYIGDFSFHGSVDDNETVERWSASLDYKPKEIKRILMVKPCKEVSSRAVIKKSA